MRYLIKNGNLITGGNLFFNTDVLIENGKIAEIGKNIAVFGDCETVDASDNYVSSGFVDMHQHGGGGKDYTDCGSDVCKTVTDAHLKHGTTSVMPTLLSADADSIIKAIENYKTALKDKNIKANLLGIHLEGPYLAPAQSGAQNPDKIRGFIPSEYKKIIAAGQGLIKRWSVAPELDGAAEFAKTAADNGITLSIAHSDADFDTVCKAEKMGFNHITHFYSCMSTVKRENGFRIAGIVEAAYYLDSMAVEIIADGCHLPESLLKLIVKLKGIDNIMLVTDSMRAAGQNVKQSYLGSGDFAVPVIIEDGVAKLENRQAFAGSIATADRLIKTMVNIGVSVADAVKAVTENPIKMMNLSVLKGKIEKGYDADICIFDKDINIKSVFVNGERIML